VARLAGRFAAVLRAFRAGAHSCPARPTGCRARRAQSRARASWAGCCPSRKYQTFRHDLLIASFHPSHRPQWTAHELCHALVGFAYRPGASTLFHVLAAWLAELIPVALWYFFDEADLRRCPRHQGGGPLFQTYCAACEREAERGPRAEDRDTLRLRREGRRFVERELAAVQRSRRLGRPLGTRFATIDLAEDAVSYVAAHGPRLRSAEMERFSQSFFAPGQGQHATLEELEASRARRLRPPVRGVSAPALAQHALGLLRAGSGLPAAERAGALRRGPVARARSDHRGAGAGAH
jgi:hypothetical protein